MACLIFSLCLVLVVNFDGFSLRLAFRGETLAEGAATLDCHVIGQDTDVSVRSRTSVETSR